MDPPNLHGEERKQGILRRWAHQPAEVPDPGQDFDVLCDMRFQVLMRVNPPPWMTLSTLYSMSLCDIYRVLVKGGRATKQIANSDF